MIEPGALLALVGPNGAGKSTLLKALVGQLTPLSGAIERAGLSAQAAGFVPQQAEIDRSFPISLGDFVGAGLWTKYRSLRSFGAPGTVAVADALDEVGLGRLEGCAVGALSGGQFQRALFCRMLLQDAPIMLLDEPFVSVDQATTETLLAMILAWHRQGRTIVAALHDLDQVRAFFPETLLLAGRAIAWGPTNAVLTDANLAEARAASQALEAVAFSAGVPDIRPQA